MTDYTLATDSGTFQYDVQPPTFGTMLSNSVGTMMTHQDPSGAYIVPSVDGTYSVLVKFDNIEGTDAARALGPGWSLTRTCVVSGIAPTSENGDVTAAMFNEALNAVITIVGDRGSASQDIPQSNYLDNFKPDIKGPGVVHVAIHYRGYPLPRYEFEGALSQVETYRDLDGVPISVSYTYPANYATTHPGSPERAGTTLQQGCKAPLMLPEPCFTVNWLVTAGSLAGVGAASATDMMTHYGMFMGTVNKDPYTLGVIDGEARTWKVVRVRGTSRDGGNTYEASMTFQYRKRTWDVPVTFVNPDDGTPPPDLVANTGYKMVPLSEEVTFPTFAFGGN